MIWNSENLLTRWCAALAGAGLCVSVFFWCTGSNAQNSMTILNFGAIVDADKMVKNFPKFYMFDYGTLSKKPLLMYPDYQAEKLKIIKTWKNGFSHEYRICLVEPCSIDTGDISEAWKRLQADKKPVVVDTGSAVAVPKIFEQCAEKNLNVVKKTICTCIGKLDDPLGCLEDRYKFVYSLGR